MLSERMSAKKSWLHPVYIYMLRISHIFLTLSTREYFILFLSFREETSIFIIVSGKSELWKKLHKYRIVCGKLKRGINGDEVVPLDIHM